MWNKFVELAKEPSYKRLLLALLVSIILHALLFGGFDLSLPFFKKDVHVIEARLQLPKAVAKQVKPAEPEPEVVKPQPKKRPKLVEQPKPNPAPETPEQEVPEATNPVSAPEVVPPVSDVPEEPVAEEPAAQTEEPSLIVNDRPYQYVETDFDVYTKIDGLPEGKGKIVYDLGENNRYKLTSLVEATGLASLIIPDLLQISDGMVTEGGLQPEKYLYQFGNKANKTYKADFNWQNKTLLLHGASGDQTLPLQRDSQDLLSFMYQFMHVAPLQKMQISITNGRKLGTYDYSFEGEETLNLAFGETKTIHISRSGTDSDEKTELWLAIDYQYLPVKIRKTEKSGKLYELVAKRINTTRPFPP